MAALSRKPTAAKARVTLGLTLTTSDERLVLPPPEQHT
jgi:hypothetical protein